MFASIVVNVTSSNVDQLYEYLVPTDIAPYIQVGSRVNVEFSGANRLVMGYVLDVYEQKRFEGESKAISELLDLKPVITPLQLELAKYLKDDTICPLIRILNMMVPSALQLKTYKYLVVKDSSRIDADLIELFAGETVIEVNSKLNGYSNKIKREIKNGTIEISYETKQTVKYRYVAKYVVNYDNYFKYKDTIKNPLKLDFLENMFNNGVALDEFLGPIDLGLGDIPVLNLSDKAANFYKSGGFVETDVSDGLVRVYCGDIFIGIGAVHNCVLRPKRTI